MHWRGTLRRRRGRSFAPSSSRWHTVGVGQRNDDFRLTTRVGYGVRALIHGFRISKYTASCARHPATVSRRKTEPGTLTFVRCAHSAAKFGHQNGLSQGRHPFHRLRRVRISLHTSPLRSRWPQAAGHCSTPNVPKRVN